MALINAYTQWFADIWYYIFGKNIPSLNITFGQFYIAILIFCALVTFIDFVKKGGKF